MKIGVLECNFEGKRSVKFFYFHNLKLNFLTIGMINTWLNKAVHFGYFICSEFSCFFQIFKLKGCLRD